MLNSAQKTIKQTARHLGLSDEQTQYLLKANQEHIFEIKLSNGKTFPAFRVQHNNALGPYKGGIRFHPAVDLDEVRALAILMSLKTSAVGLPLGGGKGGVVVNPKDLSDNELEELSRKYAAHLHPHIGPDKDVPAPDVNTNSTIIDWMADEFQKLTGDQSPAAFTGKSIINGGSVGREAATGKGGVIALRELLKLMKLDKKELTIGIQGFGNVGSYFGLITEQEQPKWQLIAATDSSGGVSDAFGLSANELDKYKRQGSKLIDFDSESGIPITNEQFIAEEVDVLVLAALGDVITEENMKNVRAKFVLELANGPVNEAAYQYLTEAGVVVIPDVLANAGGVIVSYLEWQQNKLGEHWDESRVQEELENYLIPAVKAAYNYGQEHQLPLKEATFAIAVQRILKLSK